MIQQNLFFDPQNLFEELCAEDMLKLGFKAVKKNKGSPGIDGITVEEFSENLGKELAQISKELQDWSYKPEPVKRVNIPKPGKTNEFRKLGIPCVKDRVVQATLKMLLEPIFEPIFSNNSYGFRPRRSQRLAVEAAQKIVEKGKEYCVDIDLSKFFDRIHHDRLITKLGEQVPDKRILKIVAMTLRSGIMENGLITYNKEGSVQGSPLSPILSNIVLDELDKELESRGLEFCRYADDANIFVKSQPAAERVMTSITKFIERKLKLKVNTEKSKVTKSKFTKFLGMTILKTAIAISSMSMDRAKAKVKELSPRNNSKSIGATIQEFNTWYKGWAEYHKMSYYPSQMRYIEGHFRRRIRAKIARQKKKRKYLHKALIKQGIKPKTSAKACFNNDKHWAISKSYAMNRGYNNKWFKSKGMITFSDRKLKHWFDVNQWIWLK